MMIIAGYIGMAILGGLIGWLLAGMLFNFRKWQEKKNILKNIEKQKLDTFFIPNKHGKSDEVSLKQIVGLQPKYVETNEPDEGYNDHTIEKS